jgi:histidine triad (HIT) family protein
MWKVLSEILGGWIIHVLNYYKNLEKKRGEAMKDENCIFCKLTAGEIPSTTLYEDRDFCVILDLNPASKGHALIIAKEHYRNLYDLDEELAAKAYVLAQKMVRKLKDALHCDGFNIVQNNEAVAGQTVFHFHMHLIPRYKDDKVGLTWHTGTLTEQDKREILESLS